VGDDKVKSFTLGGGIKGWVKAGEPYTQYVDGFVPEYWEQF
jgi:arsenical-resistance protein 2